MHPLRRLFGYASAYRSDLRWATFYCVANKFFDVLPELLIGVAVDVVVNQKASFVARFGVAEPRQQLLLLTALTILIWLAESWTEYLSELKWRNLAQDLQHVARIDAYGHVQKLPMAWFERNRSGQLLSVLNEDVNQMERFLNNGASDLIQVFVGSLMVGAVFFALTWKLAALALIPIPFILYGAFWFQRRLAPRYAAMREAAGHDVGAAEQQPAGHGHGQGLYRRGLRGRAHPPGFGRLPRAQCRGHPLVGRHHAGDPHRDPGRASPSRCCTAACWCSTATWAWACIRRWST